MDFFKAVEHRRSVRKYINQSVPGDVIQKAMDAAILAPNSSNMQTWRIYWVRSPQKKTQLIEACLSQGAARTAAELLVFVADPGTWKVSQAEILKSLEGNPRKDLHDYYGKLVPMLYGWSVFAPLKWLIFNGVGLFKPFVRGPWSAGGVLGVAVKSCALACENFMLAISAQGYDSCPMEGFDEVRVKRILALKRGASVVMVISVGLRDERGIWGERFRIPRDLVVHEV